MYMYMYVYIFRGESLINMIIDFSLRDLHFYMESVHDQYGVRIGPFAKA